MGWAARSRRRVAESEPFPIALEAQRRASQEILAEHGLTDVGVLALAANANAFAATMAAAAARKTQPKPACSSGCSWCCYRPLLASAFDVFHAAAAVSELPDAQRERALARVETAASLHASLDPHALQDLRQPCPLLENDRCTIYEARPATCMARNSADPEPCRIDVEERRLAAEPHSNHSVAIIPARLVRTAAEVLSAAKPAPHGVSTKRHPPEALRFIPALRTVLAHGVRESVERWLADEPLFG